MIFFSDRYEQILTFHYVTKAVFSSFQKSVIFIFLTFLILHHFPVNTPLWFPAESWHWISGNRVEVLGPASPPCQRARALNARARAHPLAESPTRGLGPQNGEAQQGRHNGETQTPKTSHINAVPRRQKATPRPDPLLFLGGPACRSPGVRSQQVSQGYINGFLWASLPFASP